MHRRHLFRTLTGIAAIAAKPLAAAKDAPTENPQPPPDDEISKVCGLIARHLDRERANDKVYEVLITILRSETRPFPIPSWLAEDETWKYAERVELAQIRKRAGIGAI